jgi:prophage regulatory protein
VIQTNSTTPTTTAAELACLERLMGTDGLQEWEPSDPALGSQIEGTRQRQPADSSATYEVHRIWRADEPSPNEHIAANTGKGWECREAHRSIRFIRLPEVKKMTGLGKTTLYEMIKDGAFPAPVKIGGRAVAWVESEVEQWAAARLADRITPEQLSQLGA